MGTDKTENLDVKLLIGLQFNLGFVLIFHFPITRSRSPFLFPVPRFPCRVFSVPFPVPCSPSPVSRSSFPVPCSLFPVPRFSKIFRSFRKSGCSSYYRVFVFFGFALPASQCHGRYVEGLHAWRAFTSCREPGRVIIILPFFQIILKQEWIMGQRQNLAE